MNFEFASTCGNIARRHPKIPKTVLVLNSFSSSSLSSATVYDKISKKKYIRIKKCVN